jgi:hypothetical protein
MHTCVGMKMSSFLHQTVRDTILEIQLQMHPKSNITASYACGVAQISQHTCAGPRSWTIRRLWLRSVSASRFVSCRTSALSRGQMPSWKETEAWLAHITHTSTSGFVCPRIGNDRPLELRLSRTQSLNSKTGRKK